MSIVGAPGRPARKKHVVSVMRDATQLACRLNVLDGKDCRRATRNSGEVRSPSSQRQYVRTTARRLARWSPCVNQSIYQWPGAKATRRPAIASPEGEPRAEPDESRKSFASLKSELYARAPGKCSPPTLRGPLLRAYPTVPAEGKLWRPRIRGARSVSSVPS